MPSSVSTPRVTPGHGRRPRRRRCGGRCTGRRRQGRDTGLANTPSPDVEWRATARRRIFSARWHRTTNALADSRAVRRHASRCAGGASTPKSSLSSRIAAHPRRDRTMSTEPAILAQEDFDSRPPMSSAVERLRHSVRVHPRRRQLAGLDRTGRRPVEVHRGGRSAKARHLPAQSPELRGWRTLLAGPLPRSRVLVTTIGPSSLIKFWARRRSIELPVARSYSTHADVSTRITRRRRRDVGWDLADRVRAAHRQRLVTGHRLTGEMSKCEVDRLGLGVHAEAIHDRLDVGVLDLDVRAYLAHTPMVHVTCTRGVEAQRPTSTASSTRWRWLQAHVAASCASAGCRRQRCS